MKGSPKTLTLTPRISEKSYKLASTNVYTFEVPMWANKKSVADAVASEFSVTVEDVRILIQNGKTKRSFRKRLQPKAGVRSKSKKAMVTVKKGDKISAFEQVEG